VGNIERLQYNIHWNFKKGTTMSTNNFHLADKYFEEKAEEIIKLMNDGESESYIKLMLVSAFKEVAIRENQLKINLIDGRIISDPKTLGFTQSQNRITMDKAEEMFGMLEDKSEPTFTVEPHGDGYALYWGRGINRHGLNLAHITECTPEIAEKIGKMMKTGQQIREEALEEAAKVCDENFQGFYNTDLALSAKRCAEAIRNLKGGNNG
jgi:hypothetical protein